jgi:hypothetical protein
LIADRETYTWDEMVALDCLLKSAQETTLAVLTAEMLPRALQVWAGQGLITEDERPAFDAGMVKLRKEPWEKLAAWLAGKADWLNLDGERFALVIQERAEPTKPHKGKGAK